jgi:hypothetical protein
MAGSPGSTPSPGASDRPTSSGGPAVATPRPPVDPSAVDLLRILNQQLAANGQVLEREVARRVLRTEDVVPVIREVNGRVRSGIGAVVSLDGAQGPEEVGGRLANLYLAMADEASQTLGASVNNAEAYRAGAQRLIAHIAKLPALQAELEDLLVAPPPSPSASASPAASPPASTPPPATASPVPSSPAASGSVEPGSSASPSPFVPGGPEPAIAPDEMLENGGFEDRTSTAWTFGVSVGAQATMTADIDDKATGTTSARVDIGQPGVVAGAIALEQAGIQIEAGRIYNLTFNARASGAREIRVRLVSRFAIVYATRRVPLTTAWTPVTLTLTTTSSDPDTVLQFGFGAADDTVWMDTLSLRPAPPF